MVGLVVDILVVDSSATQATIFRLGNLVGKCRDTFPSMLVADKGTWGVEVYCYILGDRAFGDYGFCDAFSLEQDWFAPSYLAIDQGPIIIMIENHRTGLLWDLFMRNVCILDGLDKLGFDYVK